MALLGTQDVEAMRSSVLFEGVERPRRLSRFWILLVLSSTIAAAGVVADSTATVIGAMIVAPLMLPIQGTMLSVVLGDRRNLGRSLVLVLAGAATAVAIGYLVGLLVIQDVTAATNSQVAGRVSPRLIDLLAALATGVVGSVALARKDIADTLPGVAIAIALVPPLSVVGLALESGEVGESLGALLLFLTNVAAILATGTVVMAVYGANRLGGGAEETGSFDRRRAILSIACLVVVVSVPLTTSSVQIARDTTQQSQVTQIGREWAEEHGWELVAVVGEDGGTVARFEGPLPMPGTDDLEASLQQEGVDLEGLTIELLPRRTIELGG